MANPRSKVSFAKAWRDYLKACETLAKDLRRDRRYAYLRPTVPFQQQVVALARSQDVAGALRQHWQLLQITNPAGAAALLEELVSFPRLLQGGAYDAGAISKEDLAKLRKSLLGIGGILAKSVKDMFDDLPAFAKQALTVLRELLDMLKEA